MMDIEPAVSPEVLDRMPFGVLILDNGLVKWVNNTLAEILHTSKDELTGLQAQKATESTFAPLFEDSERLCLTETNGKTRWFKRECVKLDNTSVVAHCFNDISELVKLEQERNRLVDQITSLETKDSITGLLNKKAILQAVDTQVSRSRRYENPLSVLRLSMHAEDLSNKMDILRGIGQCLKDQLRWADQIGMLDDRTFLVVLPETGLDDAKELASNLAGSRATIIAAKSSDWSIKFGVAAWQKGDDPKKLLGRLKHDQELSLIALLS